MANPKKQKTVDLVRELVADMTRSPGLDKEKREMYYRAKYKSMNLMELAYAMEGAKRVQEYAAEVKNWAEAQLDALRLGLIPEKMDETGVESVTYEELGRLGLTGDLYVSVKEGARDPFHAWLHKHKLGDLITDTINSSTLKAFVKGRMQAGKEIPEYLNVTPYSRASITKA